MTSLKPPARQTRTSGPSWPSLRRGDHGALRHRAFTLIELLVVVGIISILSAIAVPNFLEAQTRAKTARVANDQRVIATALETYMVDHGRYPPRERYPNSNLLFLAIGQSQTRSVDLARLTTPISYLTKVPIDIFEKALAPPNNVLDYWDDIIMDLTAGEFNGSLSQRPDSDIAWAVVSVGPDGLMGQPGNQGNLEPSPIFAARGTYVNDYDPTNGTISYGNIYRFSNAESAIEVFF